LQLTLKGIDSGRIRSTQQEITVLKKAGIVVAAAAATLLAVSPLAFAGEGDGGHHHGGSDVTGIDRSASGLLNLNGNDVQVPITACDNQIPVNVLGVQVPLNDNNLQVTDLLGGLGLLGKGEHGDGGTTVVDEPCNTSAGGDSVDD
jgi:hypothetical protein